MNFFWGEALLVALKFSVLSKNSIFSLLESGGGDISVSLDKNYDDVKWKKLRENAFEKTRA